MVGHFGIQALVHVPEILLGQGVPVVLRVPGDKNLPPALIGDDVQPRQVRHRQGNQIRVLLDVLQPHLGVAGVGGKVVVVKAPHQGMIGV